MCNFGVRERRIAQKGVGTTTKHRYNMDEEIKKEEEIIEEVKDEGASLLDQLKEMVDEATNGEGNVFDKLKGIFEGKEGDPSIFDKAKEMFDGKEGEPGMLDQLKEMLDKGTTVAGEVSQDFLEKAKEIFEPKEGEPGLLDKAKEMFDEGATAAGEMMDKAKDFVEQGTAAATEMAQDISQKAKEAFEPKEGEENVLDKAKEALDDAGKAAEGMMGKVQDFLKSVFGGPKNEGQA